MKNKTKETTPKKVVKPVIASAHFIDAAHQSLESARRILKLRKAAYLAADDAVQKAEKEFLNATAVNEGILRGLK